MYPFTEGEYVTVTLADDSTMRGTVLKVGADHVLIDEDYAFGDWVVIDYVNIVQVIPIGMR